MKNPEFRSRLEALIGEEPPYAWAARVGISKGAFTRIWHEGTVPTGEILARIKRVTGVSIDWLLFGEGPTPDEVLKIESLKLHAQLAGLEGDNEQVDEALAEIEKIRAKVTSEHPEWKIPVGDTLELEGFTLVPRYDVQGGMGGGQLIHSEQVVDHLAFRTEWVRSELRANPANLVLISAVGDSMEPSLSSGDLLLVDKSEFRIRDDAIYVISVNGSLLVKRVQMLLDGTVIIRSDNTAYQTQTVKQPDIEQLKIVGRVVWIGRRV